MIALQTIGWILFAVSLIGCIMIMSANMITGYQSRERCKSFIIFGIVLIVSILICIFTN